MKTTIELPDPLFKKVKNYARQRKRSFKDLVVEALKRIVAEADSAVDEPEWKRCFGRFRGSQAETRAIQEIIDNELSKVDPEEWK